MTEGEVILASDHGIFVNYKGIPEPEIGILITDTSAILVSCIGTFLLGSRRLVLGGRISVPYKGILIPHTIKLVLRQRLKAHTYPFIMTEFIISNRVNFTVCSFY